MTAPKASPPRPFRKGTMQLRDGRDLAFAEFGTPKGQAILWFHGTPGGSCQIPPDAPAAARMRGYRIIGLERPGVGGSTHKPGRTLLDWASDVEEFLDLHDIDRFAAAGLSGGGPFVLACAHELADRMVAGVSLGGIGPLDGSNGAPGYDWAMMTFVRLVARTRRPLGAVLSAIRKPLRVTPRMASPIYDAYVLLGPTRGDVEAFRRPDLKITLLDDFLANTRNGVRGMVEDLACFAAPWGFSPSDIKVPIRIWHGDVDEVVPLAQSEHLANLIPDCQLRLVPGTGHFGGFMRPDEVIADIDTLW